VPLYVYRWILCNLVVKVIVLVVIGIVVGILLIVFSFGVVEPTYQALVMNSNLMQIEFKDGTTDSGELYTEGRYFLGIGKSFITFPRTFLTIDYKASQGDAISIRSKDGLVIQIDVAFQYTLTTNGRDLLALYLRWQLEYDPVFGKIARNVIRDVAARYDAFEFFFNRSLIVGDITASLGVYFERVGCSLSNFQLLEISLPDAFSRAIQQTEVTRTKISEATVQQTKTLIEAETNLLAAKKQAEVIVTQAKARADAVLIQKKQDALSRKTTIEQELIAIKSLKSQLNFTTEELLNYLMIEGLKDSKVKITYAVDKPKLAIYK